MEAKITSQYVVLRYKDKERIMSSRALADRYELLEKNRRRRHGSSL